MREVDYGFKDSTIVYISPSIATHDLLTNSMANYVMSTRRSNITMIEKPLQQCTRSDIIEKALTKDGRLTGSESIYFIGINVWWYLGDYLLNLLKPDDAVFTAGFAWMDKSKLGDVHHTLEAC